MSEIALRIFNNHEEVFIPEDMKIDVLNDLYFLRREAASKKQEEEEEEEDMCIQNEIDSLNGVDASEEDIIKALLSSEMVNEEELRELLEKEQQEKKGSEIPFSEQDFLQELSGQKQQLQQLQQPQNTDSVFQMLQRSTLEHSLPVFSTLDNPLAFSQEYPQPKPVMDNYLLPYYNPMNPSILMDPMNPINHINRMDSMDSINPVLFMNQVNAGDLLSPAATQSINPDDLFDKSAVENGRLCIVTIRDL